ncbi:hypothetical protein VP01_420g3 [Puccinia sorghi]|uniref:Uncharacterized protein n=1 Tax=Puccinia sorghi TaxID=27349 RepID=A0A0L6UQP6_9BASI|nr:hypothetical protein VP01_420g3 [Puccinia sorghi]
MSVKYTQSQLSHHSSRNIHHSCPPSISYYLYLYKSIVGCVDDNKAFVVSPSDVVSLAAYCYLPLGTFLMKTEGIMLVPCDYQALLYIFDNP